MYVFGGNTGSQVQDTHRLSIGAGRQLTKQTTGVWQYQDESEAWQNAPTNTLTSALQSAFTLSGNQWTKPLIDAMLLTDWECVAGFQPGTTTTIDWAVGLVPSGDYIPEFTDVTFNADIISQNMTIITDSWEASAQNPTSAYCVLKVKPINSVTYGTDLKAYVTTNSGVNYEELGGLSAFTSYNNFDFVRGDASNLTAYSGSTIKLKVETDNLKDLEIYAVALGVKI
jgi:hypothetical protein